MNTSFKTILLTGVAFAGFLSASAQCCNVYTNDGYAVTTTDGICVSLAYTTTDCADNMITYVMIDTDGDGISDSQDMCPTVKGTSSNKGCPEISTETWSKFDAALADVRFATDSDSLTGGSTNALNMVASLMNANDYTLKVSGYADSTGTEAHNKVLSEKRSQRVKSYLISKGVPANRIVTAGYGEKMPEVSNATASGRAKNRRVEFDLMK